MTKDFFDSAQTMKVSFVNRKSLNDTFLPFCTSQKSKVGQKGCLMEIKSIEVVLLSSCEKAQLAQICASNRYLEGQVTISSISFSFKTGCNLSYTTPSKYVENVFQNSFLSENILSVERQYTVYVNQQTCSERDLSGSPCTKRCLKHHSISICLWLFYLRK